MVVFLGPGNWSYYFVCSRLGWAGNTIQKIFQPCLDAGFRVVVTFDGPCPRKINRQTHQYSWVRGGMRMVFTNVGGTSSRCSPFFRGRGLALLRHAVLPVKKLINIGSPWLAIKIIKNVFWCGERHVANRRRFKRMLKNTNAHSMNSRPVFHQTS